MLNSNSTFAVKLMFLLQKSNLSHLLPRNILIWLIYGRKYGEILKGAYRKCETLPRNWWIFLPNKANLLHADSSTLGNPQASCGINPT